MQSTHPQQVIDECQVIVADAVDFQVDAGQRAVHLHAFTAINALPRQVTFSASMMAAAPAAPILLALNRRLVSEQFTCTDAHAVMTPFRNPTLSTSPIAAVPTAPIALE